MYLELSNSGFSIDRLGGLSEFFAPFWSHPPEIAILAGNLYGLLLAGLSLLGFATRRGKQKGLAAA